MTPRFESRSAFYDAVAAGSLSLAQTVKAMRAQLGQGQVQYAKFVGVSPEAIRSIEQETGNPTQEVLEKIGKPFRLRIGFVVDPTINTVNWRGKT